MKFRNVRTLEDVKKFFSFIYQKFKVRVHPEDDFGEYINVETGATIFTKQQARFFNRVMNACINLCKRLGIEIYELAYDLYDKYATPPSAPYAPQKLPNFTALPPICWN